MSDKFPGYYLNPDGSAHDANGNPVPLLKVESKSDEAALPGPGADVPAAPDLPVEETPAPVEAKHGKKAK